MKNLNRERFCKHIAKTRNGIRGTSTVNGEQPWESLSKVPGLTLNQSNSIFLLSQLCKWVIDISFSFLLFHCFTYYYFMLN